jgi:hypothetical protein
MFSQEQKLRKLIPYNMITYLAKLIELYWIAIYVHKNA